MPRYFPAAIALSAAAASASARVSVIVTTQFNWPLYRASRSRYIRVSSTDVTCRDCTNCARCVSGQKATRFEVLRTAQRVELSSSRNTAAGSGGWAMPGGRGSKWIGSGDALVSVGLSMPSAWREKLDSASSSSWHS